MNIKNENVTAIIFAVLGVILFSSKAVMVKLAYEYQISALNLLLFRMLFSFPFYIIVVLWKRPKKSIDLKWTDFLWVGVFGVLGYYVSSYFDFWGLQYLKAGLERIILFVYPTIVVLLSCIIFKEKLTLYKIGAIILTYFGVLIIFWSELEFGGEEVLFGALLIFSCAITYATYIVASGWLIPKFGSVVFTAYAMLAATIAVVIHAWWSGECTLTGFPIEIYILGFLMAIFATVIPSFLISEAIKRMGASSFSIFGSIGPISTIVLAYFLLDEKITVLQLIGMCVVILGVRLVVLKKERK